MELDDLAFEVLNLILFPEQFGDIVAECKLTRNANVVADILKDLMHKKLVVAGNMDESGKFSAGAMYDSDNMDHYLYVATAKAMDLITQRKAL